jgi:3-dehydroquinate synthase
MAARAAARLGLSSHEEVTRIRDLLDALGLPIKPPAFPAEEYLAVMSHDKKVRDGSFRLVLNHGIGLAQLHQVESLEDFLKELLD